MTRLLTPCIAPPASLAIGSLLFPVEISGLDDVRPHETIASSNRGIRARGTRKGASEEVDLEEVAQSWQASAACMQLLNDVRALKHQGQAAGATALAQRLREMGYNASRVAQNASHTTASALRLAHDFVVVTGCGCAGPLVVEPNFREHFCIGSVYATERYRQLLAAIPEELVAPYSQLQDMVKLICAEMKFSFEATGNSLPPWRSTSSVLSRWSAAKAV
ncbi:hypothetical protein Agub_g2800 [Astrephomene gubernaculifera]|uniref:Uncharacterized protein n=1 Tax=Astrephomene gubernaculifera TaxID=47775 RepID=A0AAD3DHP2_9CHLO|nr:hypothetical protein Agub_g2800 [Astrephomene gubernaculifera]